MNIEKLYLYYYGLTARLQEAERALDKLDKQLAQGSILPSTFMKCEHHHLTYIQKISYERACIKREILRRCG